MDDATLSEAFWSVAHRLRHRTKAALEPWDLSPSLGRALSVLSRHGDMRLSGLAEHLRIAARSATEVADDLASRGLAERRPDPDDRRATLLVLTGKGRETAEAIRAARRNEGEQFFAGLTPTERDELGRLLRKLQ
ncbi:MarR family transcriptional regulator [Actinoplanes sp. KI2]|uniref:MarR family winged helix-turn-helix transcriptional regulator n=1 Tax=Actinoplanes sp. KI2 TaxID=2983315 RepID=UPI0021D60758|nr:MarR family transcriptional regulator [Actinoplanes sp. KI2]MCU7722446.1 MarR family transcriptional regulator [Actinoplanes sp. KI2]